MVLPLLSVCWKEHSNTVTSVCKNLLESNFLVDCTIAAEGQSLRAHRLILSACSPYFHMLFGEEREKHPIIILKDVSFDTLKAVIDFVYHGEIQIPEKNLKTFLELAESLQIKGLNDSSMKDRCKPFSCDAVRDGCPSISNQMDICEVQNTSTNNVNVVSFSEQPLINLTDAVQTDALVSYGESSSFCESVSSPVIAPSQQQNASPLPCDLSLDTEITVKEEPLHSESVMPKYEQIDECDGLLQDMHEDDSADTDEGGASELVEQNLDQFSSIASTYEGDGQVLRNALMMPKTRGPPNVQTLNEMSGLMVLPKLDGTGGAGTGGNDRVVAARPEAQEKPPTQVQKQAASRAADRPHRCNLCGVVFAHASTLKNHIRVHTGERPYKCDVCGSAFSRNSYLWTHVKTHTGERPFVCEVCGKSFALAKTLECHTRVHTGERPFTCDVCGDTFSQNHSLVRHKRKHTGERPYKCDTCGATFPYFNSLTYHKRKHTGERPYACLICGETFTQSSALRTHQRTHTGERPHGCDVCGESFTQTGPLLAHKRKHEEEDEDENEDEVP